MALEKVLITDSINPCVKAILSPVAQVDILPTMSEEELIKVIPGYSALMVRSATIVTRAVIEASNLKIIGRAGVGVDNIDVNAATQKGIIITNSPDGNTIAAAEHTLALLFAITRNLAPAVISTSSGKWERSKFVGKELYNKTLGIVGFGRIGRHVGKVARALGMSLVVYDPYAPKESVEKEGAKYFEKLEDFLKECDYVTLHVPKTKETTHLINAQALSIMKKGAFIINCSRGGIIDEAALRVALDNGQIAGAGLDVYENEPDITLSPVFGSQQVCLTPHLGASTQEAQINVAIDVAEQIKTTLTGGYARSAINIPALRSDLLESVKDWMGIIEQAGCFLSQMSRQKPTAIELIASGSLCQKILSPLEIALLKGLLAQSTESISYVNAPLIAKKRNITLKSSKDQSSDGDSILLILKTQDECKTLKITRNNNQGQIVELNGYSTHLTILPHTLIVPHKNQPSMVAQIAQILGSYQINIHAMVVSANQSNINKEISLMIINTDSAITEEILEKIQLVKGVENPIYVHL